MLAARTARELIADAASVQVGNQPHGVGRGADEGDCGGERLGVGLGEWRVVSHDDEANRLASVAHGPRSVVRRFTSLICVMGVLHALPRKGLYLLGAKRSRCPGGLQERFPAALTGQQHPVSRADP